MALVCLWCDPAVVAAGAQGSEQRLWCEPVAAGRTPRRESNTEETPHKVSSPGHHLVFGCTWYFGAGLMHQTNISGPPDEAYIKYRVELET